MISWVGRRKARREHEIVAAREIAHVGAVLVHDREALDAALLRARFVDEDDAAVEIALVAGEPLVDAIRDDVSDAPPVVGRRRVSLAVEILAREHIPQAELGRRAGHPACATDRPVTSACALICRQSGKRGCIEIGDLLDIGRLIDRREQARALQVGGDDLGDAARHGGIGQPRRREIRQRDRHRLDIASVMVILGAAPTRDHDRQPQQRRTGPQRPRAHDGAKVAARVTACSGFLSHQASRIDNFRSRNDVSRRTCRRDRSRSQGLSTARNSRR